MCKIGLDTMGGVNMRRVVVRSHSKSDRREKVIQRIQLKRNKYTNDNCSLPIIRSLAMIAHIY